MWGSFEEARERCRRDGLDGVGFVLTEADPYVVIDIDDCRDPESNQLSKKAKRIIGIQDSYVEVSPSGTGIHDWLKGSISSNARRDGIEVYKAGRFMTVTGRCLPSASPGKIARFGEEMREFLAQITEGPDTEKKKTPAVVQSLSAQAGPELDRVRRKVEESSDGKKFLKLWGGDTSDYPSQSEADLALCRILAINSGFRKPTVDALFRASNLFRKKWDEARSSEGLTYGQLTVDKAAERARRELKAKFAVSSGDDVPESAISAERSVIDGFLPRKSLAILVGHSNLGKSPLLYQAAICVAAGIPFLGRKVRKGRVLYLDYENGVAGQDKLIQTLSKYLGLDNTPPSLYRWNWNAATDNWGKKGYTALDMIARFSPDLVIIDSITAFCPEVESRNAEANRVILQQRRIIRESGCAIIATHHLVKPRRGQDDVAPLAKCNLTQWFSQARGASALINATDVRLGVEAPRSRIAAGNGGKEIALVMRGFARLIGEIPALYIAREFDGRGEPKGYSGLTGPDLLFNVRQQTAYEKLPVRFRFKEARLTYGKGDQATDDFLKKCVALKIIQRTDSGYEKFAVPGNVAGS
jgi:hypothetical protein